MFAPIVFAAVVAAQPAPVRLASPGLTYVNVDEKVGSLFSEYFARQLEEEGVEVTTAQEIAAVIGLERQKQLLGCADESSTSCLAELAGALGVDGIITGSIGKVGTGYTLALKVVSSRDGSALASYSTRVDTEDEAIDWMGQTAKSLARKLLPEEKVTLRQRAWIPAVAGGALLLGGGGAFLRASQIHGDLVTGNGQAIRNSEELESAVTTGKTLQTAGWALTGAGAVALGVAGALYLFGGDDAPVQGTAWFTPDAAGLTVGGAF